MWKVALGEEDHRIAVGGTDADAFSRNDQLWINAILDNLKNRKCCPLSQFIVHWSKLKVWMLAIDGDSGKHLQRFLIALKKVFRIFTSKDSPGPQEGTCKEGH